MKGLGSSLEGDSTPALGYRPVLLRPGIAQAEGGRAFEVLVTATIFFPINSWASKGCYNL